MHSLALWMVYLRCHDACLSVLGDQTRLGIPSEAKYLPPGHVCQCTADAPPDPWSLENAECCSRIHLMTFKAKALNQFGKTALSCLTHSMGSEETAHNANIMVEVP